MYEIRIVSDEVQFLVAGRIQHTWDESSKVGNIAAARAYLRVIGATAVRVEQDGISGWWRIDTRSASVREDDLQQHIEDTPNLISKKAR